MHQPQGAQRLDQGQFAPIKFLKLFIAVHQRAELALIEPLRTLRLVHYSAWLAQRWSDPIFPINFPWFGSSDYWKGQVDMLVEQTEAMQEAPLVV